LYKIFPPLRALALNNLEYLEQTFKISKTLYRIFDEFLTNILSIISAVVGGASPPQPQVTIFDRQRRLITKLEG